ncbi:potassium channel subfamily K member 4 isoform X2 [Lutra lutra]|uniref:potassium channel subfamily K member 4 isoform X2 n=1 Tax=Lutra lutra TaxID=9657 RepID=UPI001FD5BFC2|nr:potassium channel subfamily K member 4 isoform X2 [Lutra lutra]
MSHAVFLFTESGNLTLVSVLLWSPRCLGDAQEHNGHSPTPWKNALRFRGCQKDTFQRVPGCPKPATMDTRMWLMPWEGVRTLISTPPVTATTQPGTWAAPSFSRAPSSPPSVTATRPCARMLDASSASFMRWWGSRYSGSCWQGSGTGWAPLCAVASVTSKPSSWRQPQPEQCSLPAAGVVLDPARPGLLRLGTHYHRELAASSVPTYSGRDGRPHGAGRQLDRHRDGAGDPASRAHGTTAAGKGAALPASAAVSGAARRQAPVPAPGEGRAALPVLPVHPAHGLRAGLPQREPGLHRRVLRHPERARLRAAPRATGSPPPP